MQSIKKIYIYISKFIQNRLIIDMCQTNNAKCNQNKLHKKYFYICSLNEDTRNKEQKTSYTPQLNN